PMVPDIVPFLKPAWEAARKPTDRLFPHTIWHMTLRADLAAAGIARQDEEGRWLDFHSFRYFFCWLLARTLPIETVQSMMRHSTITLTMDLYKELGVSDIRSAIAGLPPQLPGA